VTPGESGRRQHEQERADDAKSENQKHGRA
jgi:hypothetical protein